MAEQLSGTIVVIVIALGVQGCILLFIFAKRQIVRFALRNRRGPHVSVGHGAPKWLRRDIDKALDQAVFVRCEPRVNSETMVFNQHYCRARAIEMVTHLEDEVIKEYSRNYVRHFNHSLRVFLLRAQNGPFAGVDASSLHKLCDLYEHARYHYEPFTEHSLELLERQVNILRNALQANRRVKPCPSPLPLKLDQPIGSGGHRGCATTPTSLIQSSNTTIKNRKVISNETMVINSNCSRYHDSVAV